MSNYARAEHRRNERRHARGYRTSGYPICTEDADPATIKRAEQAAHTNLTRQTGTARRSTTRYLRYDHETRAAAADLVGMDTGTWFDDHPDGWLIIAICDVHAP